MSERVDIDEIHCDETGWAWEDEDGELVRLVYNPNTDRYTLKCDDYIYISFFASELPSVVSAFTKARAHATKEGLL